MYCHNCGKNNPEGSKFCQSCGIKLNEKQTITPMEHKEKAPAEKTISSDTPPYPYIISISKLIILSIATFGIYEVYWFYKQWKSIKEERKLKVTPWARAWFSPLYANSLFKNFSELVVKIDKNRGLPSGWLALAYFILLILWRLPEWYWLIGFLSFLPLIPAQNAINFYWDKKYDGKVEKSGFGTWNVITTIIGGIVVLLAVYGTFFPEDAEHLDNQPDRGQTTTQSTSDFKQSYKKSFVESCSAEGEGLYEYCSCVAEYLTSNHTEGELLDMSKELNAGNTPEAMNKAIEYCLD